MVVRKMKKEKLKKKWPPYYNTIIEWVCLHCKTKTKSYSWEPHKLDMCKCGKSGIDLEGGSLQNNWGC